MKATLKFLKDFYSPLHKKTFTPLDSKKNSIEIDVDDEGIPLHSFWRSQLSNSAEYFELIVTPEKQSKKAK